MQSDEGVQNQHLGFEQGHRLDQPLTIELEVDAQRRHHHDLDVELL